MQPMDTNEPGSLPSAASLLPAEGRRFHLMAKPVGAACNLNCSYCFYLSKQELGGGIGAGRMSNEVLEAYIAAYINSQQADEIVFTWQGGEPMLLGLDFYRKVIELQKMFCPPGKRVENDLQTNGMLIDEEWCQFLKGHRFHIGLSIDGPKRLHDSCRVGQDGRATFDQVAASFGLLRKHGIPVSTLTVVHAGNVGRPLDVYRFLVRELKSDRIQFIPCVEPKSFTGTAPQCWPAEDQPVTGTAAARPGTVESIVTDWSVDPEAYGRFLCDVFDEWYRRDAGKVFVNLFETLISQHLGQGPQICVFNDFCGKALVVEHDGSLYSCDHYVYPEYRLGSIVASDLGQMVFSERQVQFALAKNTALLSQCRTCAYLTDCWGECPRNRFVRTSDGQPGLNYLCPGLKRFFEHAVPTVDKIVWAIRQGNW